jgi:hypothetical protein
MKKVKKNARKIEYVIPIGNGWAVKNSLRDRYSEYLLVLIVNLLYMEFVQL